MPVEPNVNRRWGTFERNESALVFQAFINGKVPDIRGNGIMILGDGIGTKKFASVPRILRIDVLRFSKSLKLKVSRDFDGIKTAFVKTLLIEVPGTQIRILPVAVQRLNKGRSMLFEFSFISVIMMIGVRIDRIDFKNGRIRKPVRRVYQVLHNIATFQ